MPGLTFVRSFYCMLITCPFRFGPRFPAMTHPYDPDLRKMAREIAAELEMDAFIREGVYCHLCGPSYETPFESRFLKLVGCDAVGMSTAPEVVVAKHCGMAVLGIVILFFPSPPSLCCVLHLTYA